MGCDHRKRVKLKRERQSLACKEDIFDSSHPQRLECEAGDRVTNAHIKHFTEATEALVERTWGHDASTSTLIQHWEHLILGQLLDLLRCDVEYKDVERCETCLINVARSFAASAVLERAESERAISRPLQIWSLRTFDLQIYITSAYLDLLRTPARVLIESDASIYTALYLRHTATCQTVHSMTLTEDSKVLLGTPNAGGSSLESEVLSFEVLQRVMPFWRLCSMEMETRYDSNGPILDFITRSSQSTAVEWCVSVTRVFKWSRNLKISSTELMPLLRRKLDGLQSAAGRVLPRRKRGKLLFIWVPSGCVERSVHKAWNKCTNSSLTRGVMCFVGVCRKESWLDTAKWERVFLACK